MRRISMIYLGLLLAAPTALAVPDLTCSITVDQFTDVSGPEPVKKVALTVSVSNLGDTAANTMGIEPILVFRDLENPPDPLVDSPDVVFDFAGGTLGAGAEASFTLDEEVTPPGSYKAWCLVNPDIGGGFYPVAGEVNFDDNLVSKPYIVTPPPIAAPDLIITTLEATSVGPYEYDFTVVVENVGGAAAGPFQVDVFPDEDSEPTWSTPGLFSNVFCTSDGLAAQEAVGLSCTPTYNEWTPLDIGTQTVYAYVDIGNEVTGETSETNNSFSADIEVTAPAELSTVNFLVGSDAGEVTYEVTIGNAGGALATTVSIGLVYQSEFAPTSCADADDVQVVPLIQAESSTLVQFQRSGAIGGEGFQAWVIVDCDNTVPEGSEGDNVASFSYDVDGVPNVPPVITEVVSPDGCRETEECVWSVAVDDVTLAGTQAQIRVENGPEGMYGDTLNQGIVYVPPLGSTAESIEFTLVVDDGLGGTDEQVLSFEVAPRTDFRGIVGEKGSLPTGLGNQCALFEVPGSGFIWVDREDYEVRVIRNAPGELIPLDQLPAALTIPVASSHNVPSPFLSCHVAVAPAGGFLLFETTTQVLLHYGSDGTFLRKVNLEGVTSGAEVFAPFAGNTYVFLDTVQSFPFPALYFIDVTTGALDTTLGALAEDAQPGDPTTGRIPLDVASDWSSEYLWIGPDRLRLFARQFGTQGFTDFSFSGEVLDVTLIEDTPLAGIVPTGVELYLPMAAPDGGLMLQDFSTATLRWYQADFSPRANFSLPAPGQEAEPGVVSLQSYGYSVDNIRCEVLPAGGWTCHDFTGQQGFVVDEFGELYDYCPVVSVSPASVEFGGVTAFETAEKTVTVVNAGSGVLVVDGVSVTNQFGGSQDITPGAFPTSPFYLQPGTAVSLDFEYQPTSAGEAGLTLNINAVSDDPACAASKISIPVVGFSGARLAVTPNIVEFDGVGGGEHRRTVTLQSVGSTALQLGSIGLADNTTFQLDPPNVPAISLVPGATLEFDVVFDGAVEGEFNTTLNISSNDATVSNLQVPVTARTGPRLEIEPPGLRFDGIEVGDSLARTVTIRNVGETAIEFDEPLLSGVGGFTLESDGFVPSLAKGESTTLTVRYTPTVDGTRLAKLVVTHDSAAIEPLEVLAVAGTGTDLPQGFDGVLSFADAYGPIGMTGGALELRTGGFAVWGATTGAIHTLAGDGAPINPLGTGGVIQMTGPGGAFPDASALGASLVELESGDLAMLSPVDRRIYVVRPDGVPNPYVGEGGVIDIAAAGGGLNALGTAMAQLNDGPASGALIVFETDVEQLVAVELDGGLAPAFGALGRVNLAATGTGANLAVRGTGDIIFGDVDGGQFLRLTEIGNDVPGSGSAASYDGALVPWRTPFETAYYDPVAGTVQVFEDAFSAYIFDNGSASLDVASVWPAEVLGPALVVLREGGIAVSTQLNDRLVFVSEDGAQLTLDPDVAVTLPEAHDFGNVAVGDVSEPLEVVVNNTGTFPLTVSPVFGNALFQLADGAMSVVIPPGESATLNVVYAPTFKGVHNSTLQLATNDPDEPLVGTTALSGTTGADLVMTPDVLTLDFGNVAVNESKALTLSFENLGVADVTVDLPVVGPSPFGVGTKVVNGVLAPGAAPSQLELVFSPSEEGTFFGLATIAHNDATKPPYVVQLVGRSGAQISVSPSNLSCVGTVGALTSCGSLAVKNVGSAPLTIHGVGIDNPAFEVAPVNVVLQPGQSLVDSSGIPLLQVFYRGLSPEQQTGTLTLLHSDMVAGGVTTVSLKGMIQGDVIASPGSVDFGAVPVGVVATKTVTVSGLGSVLSATVLGDGELSAGSAGVLPAVLANGDVVVPVRCAPQTAGTFSGTLVIATSVVTQPSLTVPLACAAGPLLTASPDVIDFGPVATGESRTRLVGITNSGVVDATVLSANATGVGFSSPGLEQSVTLSPGESVAVPVTFTSQQEGTSTGTLTIQPSGAPPTLVPLLGTTGSAVSIHVPTNPIDFGVRAVGSSTELPVIVTNTGSSAASFGGASISAAPFSVVDVPSTGPIAPGGQVVFNVRFGPPVAGNYAAVLSVIADGETTEIDVFGKAGGSLFVAPDTVAFGQVPVGQSVELPLGVSNVSPDTSVEVRVLQGGDTGAFELVGLSDGDKLPANTSLSDVRVRFTPPTERDFESVFTFTTNDGVEGQAYTVTVTGRSGAQVALIHPSGAFHAFEAVPVGDSRSLPLRISAPGSSSAAILGYSIEGADGDELQFALNGLDALPTVLPSQSVAELEVQCAPTEAGVFEATLFVATDAPDTPNIEVKLWCSTPASLEASTRRLVFGGIPLLTPQQQTVTVANTGGEPVLLTSATLGASPGATLEIMNPLSGNTVLEAGASREFVIRLTPQEAGVYDATLTIESNDVAAPQLVVAVSGYSGPRLDIGDSAVLLCSSGTKNVALENTGTTTVVVESADLVGLDSGLQASFNDSLGQPLPTPFFLEPGETAALAVSWNGVLDGVNELSDLVTIASDDPRGELTVDVVVGRGWVVPNEFNGVADLGAPGTPAYPGASGMGASADEVCTGGGVYSSVVDSALYFGSPGALGGAVGSIVWGQGGIVDLAAVIASRSELPQNLTDIGAYVRTFDGGDLIAVAAPATGHWFLLRPNGKLATNHPSGGIISLAAALPNSSVAISGSLDRRDDGGFVTVERVSGTVVWLATDGQLGNEGDNPTTVQLGNVFPEFDVSETVGESVLVLANGSVAITDGANGQIFVLRPDGQPDTTLGANNSGVLTLNPGFVPEVATLGGLLRFGAGFIAVEPARNSLLFAGAGGGPNPGALGGATDNGRLRVVGPGGAFPSAGRLGASLFETSEDGVASAANAGKWMLFDSRFNDILVLDDADGTGFESGLPELQAECPVTIQQGQSGSLQVVNTGQTTLSISEVTASTESLTCVGCDGSAIVPGGNTTLGLQWAVPDGALGCFEEQLTLVHDGVNNPTVCPVLLGTNASFQVVPGSDSAFQYTFPPVSAGGTVVRDLVIRNAGCLPFTLQSLVLSGDDVFSVPAVPGDGVELGFGDVYVASVACAPSAAGQYSGALVFGTSGNVSTQPLQLFCTSGPYLDRTANSLDWGSQALGTGGSRTVSFTSAGGAPATLLPIDGDGPFFRIEAPAGTPEGTFELLTVPSVGPEIAVGDSFDLTVIFTPPEHGEFTAELVVGVDSYDAVASEIRIPLSGTSTAEPIFVPGALDFGIVPVDTEACETVDVQNDGAVNLDIQLQAASLEGTPFRIDGNVVVTNILPFNANTKQVELCCQPTAAGLFEQDLDIALDGAATELTQYSLTCRGESCLVRAEGSDPIEFGEVRWDESPSETITLTADDMEQAITVEVTGAGAEQVVLGQPTVSGDNVTVSVTIDAADPFVPVDATIAVTSGLCDSTLSVPVRATIIPPEDGAADTDDATDGTDSTDGTTGTDAVDATDQTDATDGTDGADATSGGIEGTDATDGAVDGGGDDGCGCDMAPRSEPFPTGPAALLLLIGLAVVRSRARE